MLMVSDSIREFFGTRYAVPVGSGTVGLATLLKAVPVRGRRVLIPALACPNVAVSVRAAGGIPTLIDMDPATYDLSLGALEAALADGVAALVVIDAFGYPSAVSAVAAIARNAGCFVVEDACQAYGGHDGGVPMGARGDAAVVSFGYAKPLELGGGGLVLTDDEAVVARIVKEMESWRFRPMASWKNRMALKFMLKDEYQRMLDWEGRIGLLGYQFPPRILRRLETRFHPWVATLSEVRANIARARTITDSLPGVEPFQYRGDDWLPWRYSFKVPRQQDRDMLIQLLARHGVRTSRLYRPVSEFMDVEGAGDVTGARTLADITVNLAYRSTPADSRALVEKLERVLEEVSGA